MKKTLKILIIAIIICLITYLSNSEKKVIEKVIEEEYVEEVVSNKYEDDDFVEVKYEIEIPEILEKTEQLIEEVPIEENETYYFSFSNFPISNEDQEIIDNNLDGFDPKGAILNFTGVNLDDSSFELFKQIESGKGIMGTTIDVFGSVIDFEDCKSNPSGQETLVSEGTNKEGEKNNHLVNSIFCNSESYTFKVEIRINYLTFDGRIIGEKNFHIDTLLVEKELKTLNEGTKKLSANTNGMFENNNNHGYLINEN